ncbi:MAG: hypothetical protein J6Y47_01855, partial [Bacteroidales bacterium]|nr:hypothetical protein [Bacteroidales bacterium]
KETGYKTLFDDENRHEKLSKIGNPLEKLSKVGGFVLKFCLTLQVEKNFCCGLDSSNAASAVKNYNERKN